MSHSPKAVFLSYASQDSEAARRICEALRAAGLEVWFDQSELCGGDAWDASIRKQVRECALFVPFVSANTDARSEGYFRLEWRLAIERSQLMADDQAFLLPVVLDDTTEATARVPDRFRERQWMRLAGEATTAAFVERVLGLLRESASTPPPPAEPVRAASSPVRTAPAPSDEVPSIAVLPFVNLSRSEDNEYFADGLAEELLNVLAKIRGLRVASRTSAFSFKGKDVDIPTVARKLNVATILEGSVRASGKRVRITAQLIRVADDSHLWSETYDRTLEDIFAVQDDIAHSVVEELRTTLLGGNAGAGANGDVMAEVAMAVRGRGLNADAHRLYLQGRHFVERGSREDVEKGIGYLKEAVDLEPSYALAWADLGHAHAIMANSGWVSVSQGYTLSREAAERSLQLEPDLPEGHAQMGWYHMHRWDWPSAEASYRRALELAPGNVSVLLQASTLAKNLGRLDEAIALNRRAIEQDPLSASLYGALGASLFSADRLAEAEEAYRKVLELAPQRITVHARLSLLLLGQGRREEALAEARQEPEEWARLWASAIVCHAAAQGADSDAALQSLVAKYESDAAYQIAEVHAMRGEAELAFGWLERSYAQRDPGLTHMKTAPLLASLHEDPRWPPFLEKMGLWG